MNSAVATVPRVIATISAERMKSVRTAPLILSFSTATRSTVGSTSAWSSSAWWASSSFASWRNLCASFSNPSKQRNAPPIIRSGVTAHGMNALIASAAGHEDRLVDRRALRDREHDRELAVRASRR